MTSYPAGLPIALDRGVRVLGGGAALLGGDPRRAIRLSHAGAAALPRLCAEGAGPSAAAQRLVRTLVDGGLAHPRPGRRTAPGDVLVVVPVRDRPGTLDRCLSAVAGGAVAVLVVDDGSRDAGAVADVCARHGARLVRHNVSGGPGAARNTALVHAHEDFVAFLDSDCVPEAGWLDGLVGHFEDPLVAAVAPRVRGHTPEDAGPLARFAAARSPLDGGRHPGRVQPGGRVSYVPSAALLVRRSVLTDGFDPALRYGEDVDFVWRLHDDGWRVRYEPAVTVHHAEPESWRDLLLRRWHYGTSAAPLAERHPGRLAPLVAHPWPATIALLLLARRPRTAGAVALVQSWTTARRLRSAGLPARHAPVWAARGVAQTVVATGHAATTIAPLLLVAGVRRRPTRAASLVLLLAPPLLEWCAVRPRVDPVRWVAFCLADDVAYGTGVWCGALRARRPAPLLPVVAHAGSSNAAAPATPVVPTCRIGRALRRARGYVQQVARTVARPIPSGRRPEPHQRTFRTPSSGSPDHGISPPTIG